METHLKIYKISQRISNDVHFEAYFDLWGFSMGWIDAICKALHKYTEPSQGDTGESYQCAACMAFRFTSTSHTRTEQARKIFKRLANLATADQKRHLRNIIGYVVLCG